MEKQYYINKLLTDCDIWGAKRKFADELWVTPQTLNSALHYRSDVKRSRDKQEEYAQTLKKWAKKFNVTFDTDYSVQELFSLVDK